MKFKCTKCGRVEDADTYGDGKTQNGNMLCFSCRFWTRIVADGNAVIADGRAYEVAPEWPKTGMRGSRGLKFVIEHADGSQTTTTNLWYRGTVPAHFRDELPDNANLRQPEKKNAED